MTTQVEIITSFAKYQEGALITFNKMNVPTMDVLHCVLGMVEEAKELFDVGSSSPKFILELGDCMWYSAVACMELGIPYEQVMLGLANPSPDNGDQFPAPPVSMMMIAAQCCGVIKKDIFYHRGLSVAPISSLVIQYLEELGKLAKLEGVNLLEAATANRAKLFARYKGGSFDSGCANNKNEQAEGVAALGCNQLQGGS